MPDMSSAHWEQYTAFPFDREVVPLPAPLVCGQIAIAEGSPAIKISFSRRINHFEADSDHFESWLDRLADDIVAGAREGEPTPPAVVHYGVARIGNFSWANSGFDISPGTPMPGDQLKHPIDRRPLTDTVNDPRQAVTAAIHTLDLLANYGDGF